MNTDFKILSTIEAVEAVVLVDQMSEAGKLEETSNLFTKGPTIET